MAMPSEKLRARQEELVVYVDELVDALDHLIGARWSVPGSSANSSPPMRAAQSRLLGRLHQHLACAAAAQQGVSPGQWLLRCRWRARGRQGRPDHRHRPGTPAFEAVELVGEEKRLRSLVSVVNRPGTRDRPPVFLRAVMSVSDTSTRPQLS
jgi:hypothetical protein